MHAGKLHRQDRVIQQRHHPPHRTHKRLLLQWPPVHILRPVHRRQLPGQPIRQHLGRRPALVLHHRRQVLALRARHLEEPRVAALLFFQLPLHLGPMQQLGVQIRSPQVLLFKGRLAQLLLAHPRLARKSQRCRGRLAVFERHIPRRAGHLPRRILLPRPHPIHLHRQPSRC